MVLIDTVSRLIPGVLSSMEGAMGESVYSGLLEYDQYTKPREYEGLLVPEVLLNGNHKEIDEFRRKSQIEKTTRIRPDLMEK